MERLLCGGSVWGTGDASESKMGNDQFCDGACPHHPSQN